MLRPVARVESMDTLATRSYEPTTRRHGFRGCLALRCLYLAYHRCMTLTRSNPYLRSVANRKAALRVSAQTSSAVEGIRAPFAKSEHVRSPADVKAFIAHWKRRAAATGR